MIPDVVSAAQRAKLPPDTSLIEYSLPIFMIDVREAKKGDKETIES